MKAVRTNNLDSLLESISPIRQSIMNHNLYGNIDCIADLKIFTQHHVYAVWDFMSLLKSLQSRLTCTSAPWTPRNNKLATRLINEIVLGEESDELAPGEYGSHFDLYREAMVQLGADVSPIDELIERIQAGESVWQALEKAPILPSQREFVSTTWSFIESGSTVRMAAALTLGREDIIPEMFTNFVADLHNEAPERVALFKTYLDRHIYVDGEQHRPMSFKMLESLCQTDDDWTEAQQTATLAMKARLQLWDDILEKITTRKNNALKRSVSEVPVSR